jgi:hypothetical protein
VREGERVGGSGREDPPTHAHAAGSGAGWLMSSAVPRTRIEGSKAPLPFSCAAILFGAWSSWRLFYLLCTKIYFGLIILVSSSS